MKKKKLAEFQKKAKAEIEKEIAKSKKELVEVEAKISMGEEKNVKKAKNIRKDIAQLKTISRTKKEK